ncbi:MULTISPECIES: FAD-dependent oxidoreductase [unclassified Sphingomonas]|uniref:FAD-dependent oxidoreductase n=1 Tax=unclassified Sphingomonas TaxID=196159 RepID=UPI0006F36545|nr:MULTISPECIES: GMC family oxidoreductase [unclassified Sphingomonas]KQX20832.1 oxidoreductase [Sphingomonas sp. Root1294]KQY68678.1 oxidoreductase [Sphingomonas sp. Root50]KRB88083.1 oxidoreductase [Sphingomonas sp. Root720]
MHIDLDRGGPDGMTADVAVIGAGAAGIAVCRRLLAEGLSVILLESGGFDHEAGPAALNRGENIGEEYYRLEDSRLRFFGGTTAIWGGRCAEFDPIDFERRPWVPHSGWPIDHAEVAPYYAEARTAFGLPRSLPDLGDALGAAMPAFADDELSTPAWLFDERFDRFSHANSRDLLDHPRCTVVTHATVREILATGSARGVDRLVVRGLAGQRLTVTARHYVLAAGGIENPRLLLASRSVMRSGLGNGHDQVGRYFMEHPHARGGRIVGGATWALLRAFGRHRVGGLTVAPLIAAAPALQAREGLLNTSLTLAGRRSAESRQALLVAAYERIKHDAAPTARGRHVWKMMKRTVNALQKVVDPARPWALEKLGMTDLALVVRAEQAPNPDSRVTLGDALDATGMPRARLDWRTSAIDVDSVRGLVGALGRELERLGLGKVEPAPWLAEQPRRWTTDPLISTHPIGGYHHMGTTRMADDPRQGVTDGQGRVHGIDNLYVAGSSLFPTSGWANPTLTIVALAMRTADRIAARLRMSSAPSLHRLPPRSAAG